MTKSHKTLSDKELVALVSQDRAAFSELYDRYAPSIFRKCFALLKNKELAQDTTHDIFIKSFTSLASLKDGQSFAKWLSVIAYNKCMDVLKINQKSFTERLDDYDYQLANNDTERQLKINHEMQLNKLERAFSILGEADRLLLLMQLQDNMSIKEIQEILGLNSSAVKMRLKRAKDKLAIIYQDINAG